MNRTTAKKLTSELVRYLIVSLIALGVDFGVYLGLIRFFSINYLISAALGFVVGLVFSYLLSVVWVFSSRNESFSRSSGFVVYGVIGLLGLFVNETVIFLSVTWLGLGYVIAKLWAAGASFLFNFLGRKIILFSHFDIGPNVCGNLKSSSVGQVQQG